MSCQPDRVSPTVVSRRTSRKIRTLNWVRIFSFWGGLVLRVRRCVISFEHLSLLRSVDQLLLME